MDWCKGKFAGNPLIPLIRHGKNPGFHRFPAIFTDQKARASGASVSRRLRGMPRGESFSSDW